MSQMRIERNNGNNHLFFTLSLILLVYTKQLLSNSLSASIIPSNLLIVIIQNLMKKQITTESNNDFYDHPLNQDLKGVTPPKVHYSYDKLVEYLYNVIGNMFKSFDPSSIVQSFPEIANETRVTKEKLINLFKQSKSYAIKNAIAEANLILKQFGIQRSLDEMDSINMRKEIFSQIDEQNWVDEDDEQQEYLKEISDIISKKLRLLKQTIDINLK